MTQQKPDTILIVTRPLKYKQKAAANEQYATR
jgi:hypothetical protein